MGSDEAKWNRTTHQYADNVRGISYKRSCTNYCCLMIFIVFISCWMAIGYYAYWNGDINRLYDPRDSYGRTCGVDEDVKNSPYLFFFDITECVSLSIFIFGCANTKQICVSKCPEETWFFHTAIENASNVNWKKVQQKLICEDEKIARSVNTVQALENVINERRCAPYYVTSTSALLNVCIPNPLNIDGRSRKTTEITEKIVQTQQYLNDVAKIWTGVRNDLHKCWHLLVLFITTAIVSCLFVILIMGVVTKVFVWTILSFIFLLLLYCSVLIYIQYHSTAAESPTVYSTPSRIYPDTLYEKLRWTFQQKNTWLYLLAALMVALILYVLLIVFLRSKIDVTVMLIGEGSKAINTIKSTLCLPLATRVLQLGIVLWFLLVYLYVKTLGNSVYKVHGLKNDTDCQCLNFTENDWCLPKQFNDHCTSRSHGGVCSTATCKFLEYRYPEMQFCFQLYNFFGLLWGVFFVSGFNRMILSFCFATWYWTYDKNSVPFFTLTRSMFVTVRYHLGTIAMGSFLIASCGCIRTMLERVYTAVKRTDGMISQCVACSMRCCFWMLEKFLIFISNNAYIMCAIVGKGFFDSASKAFGLLTRNVIRVVVLDKVMDFIMLVGKIVITSILACISYLSFSADTLGLDYPVVPTVIVGVATWLISSSFFGVYTIAVDTLFLSFLEDGELNDGSQNRPYYMSRRLKYFLKEKTR